MEIEVVKVTNGLGETLYRAYHLEGSNRVGTVAIAGTLEGVERYVRIYKLKSQVQETLIKTYEI